MIASFDRVEAVATRSAPTVLSAPQVGSSPVDEQQEEGVVIFRAIMNAYTEYIDSLPIELGSEVSEKRQNIMRWVDMVQSPGKPSPEPFWEFRARLLPRPWSMPAQCPDLENASGSEYSQSDEGINGPSGTMRPSADRQGMAESLLARVLRKVGEANLVRCTRKDIFDFATKNQPVLASVRFRGELEAKFQAECDKEDLSSSSSSDDDVFVTALTVKLVRAQELRHEFAANPVPHLADLLQM